MDVRFDETSFRSTSQHVKEDSEDARCIRFNVFSGYIAGTYRCDSRDVSRVGGDIGIPGGNEKSHKTGIKNDRSVFLRTFIAEKTK